MCSWKYAVRKGRLMFHTPLLPSIFQVVESIMAQNQVETERRLDRLHEQIKEQEIMLEDEVARLEVYLGEKLDAADLKLDETVAQVRGRFADSDISRDHSIFKCHSFWFS